jgi:hypothetical protein
MAQDHVGDGGEIDAEVAGILQHGLGVHAGVEQDPVPVGFHQHGEAPLSHAAIGQHGGQGRDLE